MITKKLIRKKLINTTPALVIIGVLAVLLCVCGYFAYREYVTFDVEPVAFDSLTPEGTYVYADLTMVDEVFASSDSVIHKNDRTVYHFALDEKGGILILAISESKFNETLNELYEYTKGSVEAPPGPVRITGYATKLTEELYNIASTEWGTTSFDYYFGSCYFNCEANDRLFIIVKWGIITFVVLFFIVLTAYSVLKKKMRFNRCFKRLNDIEERKSALVEITTAGPFSRKNEYLFTDNFVFFPPTGAFYPYRDICLAFRKQKRNFVSGNMNVLFLAAADSSINKAASLVKGKEGDRIFDGIVEELMGKNPNIMLGLTSDNREKYNELLSAQNLRSKV